MNALVVYKKEDLKEKALQRDTGKEKRIFHE